MAMAVSGAVAAVASPVSFSKAQLLATAPSLSVWEGRRVGRNGKLVARTIVSAVVGEKAPGAALPDSAQPGMSFASEFVDFGCAAECIEFATAQRRRKPMSWSSAAAWEGCAVAGFLRVTERTCSCWRAMTSLEALRILST